MKEYLATLDDAAFGAASDVTPKFISPSDPAAQWTGAMRGPAFFAYADNYLKSASLSTHGAISTLMPYRDVHGRALMPMTFNFTNNEHRMSD